MVTRTILTYDGMRATPDDGLRRELLGGALYVSPAPSPKHQAMVGEVFVALRAYAAACGGRAFVAPIDVVFSQTDATQPDVLYIDPHRLALVGDAYIEGAPSLIVEVVSPSSSEVDPGRKLQTYARHGVPEYWIVAPATNTAVAYAEPSGERYLQSRDSAEGVIESFTLPGLRFSLSGPASSEPDH